MFTWKNSNWMPYLGRACWKEFRSLSDARGNGFRPRTLPRFNHFPLISITVLMEHPGQQIAEGIHFKNPGGPKVRFNQDVKSGVQASGKTGFHRFFAKH